MRRRSWITLLLLFALGAAGGYLLNRPRAVRLPPGEMVAMAAPSEGEVPASRPGATIEVSRRNAIVEAADRVGPAVVSVNVLQTQVYRNPFFTGDPYHDQFFQRFFGVPPEYRRQIRSMGSGVIVDPGGIVITNDHVVQGADEIKVVLTDGRSFDAKLAGADPASDVAVLRFEGASLPVAPLGGSDDLMVGEWAIAIGNPFGYLLADMRPSVTVGVVSGVDRDFRPEGDDEGRIYKGMIQTDAAINPGNSGGPLVNANGEIIGINTFILSRSGGSEGLGFAIPIDTVKRVMEEIERYGEVRRAWIGFSVRDISPFIAERLGLQDARGVVVWSVDSRSPAEEAGMEPGDVIRKVNGRTIADSGEARLTISGARIGEDLKLTMEREGKTREINIRVREEPKDRRAG
jgi:serine protease Do